MTDWSIRGGDRRNGCWCKTLQDCNKCLNRFRLCFYERAREFYRMRGNVVKRALERNCRESRCKTTIGNTAARNKGLQRRPFEEPDYYYYYCYYFLTTSRMQTAVDRYFGIHERYRVASSFFNLQRVIAAPNSWQFSAATIATKRERERGKQSFFLSERIKLLFENE